MTGDDVRRWFGEYLEAFAACVTLAYLVTEGPAGRRISAMAVHPG